ncbi:hypothetical protein BDA99DRAFT_570985 [Phascolomyces articulosus]|uniref:Uncharacterized protein n=1 Tax=Phascolomyces articulosus TaxID=60185 RepID=A0AAD5KCN6_9FUNG|nr:hypothetical protein BDA99DRAFT_570985 [Phascolomyces articulosus]
MHPSQSPYNETDATTHIELVSRSSPSESNTSHITEQIMTDTKVSSKKSKDKKYPVEKKKKRPSTKRKVIMTKLSSARELLSMIFLPILNILLTIVLMGMLVYVYVNADGKPIDYTMASMKVPSMVALLTTLLKMCIAGGIGYAVSEYKWVRLQDGGRLSLIDLYDACTRGVGGAFRVIASLRLDYIIVPAILFQFGLIAIGPASQVVLTTYTGDYYCLDPTEQFNGGLNHVKLTEDDLSTLKYPFDQRLNYGVKEQYVAVFGFDTAPYNASIPINYSYDIRSISLDFPNVTMFLTDMECKNGTFGETQVIDPTTRNAVTMADFYGTSQPMVAPRVFYAGSMFNRTYYDIARQSVPSMIDPNGRPEVRAFVGDQTFVFMSYQGQATKKTVERTEDIVVRECTLRTYQSNNTIRTGLGSNYFVDYGYKELINMDYDLLINASFWNDDYASGTPRLMLNAYSYQLTLMTVMTVLKQDAFQDRLANMWANNNPNRNTMENFLRDAFNQTDLAMSLVRPERGPASTFANGCYPRDSVYQLNPVSYYIISLICIVPLLWWVLMWIISLYQTNGISRGNSQIALLVTGFTKSAAEQFKGYSYASQRILFQKASTVDVSFGEVKRMDNRAGHIAFGLENELHPLRARRRPMSYRPS